MFTPATRTLVAAPAGPVRLTFPMKHIPTVVQVADVPAVEVTLTTRAAPGTAAADAINAASMTQHASDVTVNVPDLPGAAEVSVTSVSRGGSRTTIQTVTNLGAGAVIVGGDFYGEVDIDDGRVSMRGTTVGATILTGGMSGVIQAEIRIPASSALNMTSKDAGLTVRGEVVAINYTSTSGSLHVDACQSLTGSSTGGVITADVADRVVWRTVSGRVRLGRTENVQVSSVSGPVHIADFGGVAEIQSVSGRISVDATEGGTITATSTSGDILVTAAPGLADAVGDNRLIVNARSLTGYVSIPQPTASTTRRPRPTRRRP
ncbi:DUF4097 domain-containing protein [Nonomuraea turkmeniaca]|uniref:DUF4097 domain-containing protein n=1 Tax=Nonomuraea turkmeniaca TaxID=103838 RepID=A0A5S4FMY3_9ACTN|nr:DUF4097 family beta strand repeat-containing protein [Nonomuraea turkmeniaca]TMR22087.1 DUF4097 domain-containing protein [Nonomuraea turkmeniaca]